LLWIASRSLVENRRPRRRSPIQHTLHLVRYTDHCRLQIVDCRATDSAANLQSEIYNRQCFRVPSPLNRDDDHIP
jgi:hypothetical protein